jgi:nicotinamide-nucleotide amidase
MARASAGDVSFVSMTNDAELFIVGDELHKGERGDAHLSYLGRALRPRGVRVAAARVVGDSVDRVAEVVRSRLGSARVLIVAGGLGPTPDDITRDGVARGIDRPLEFDEDSWGWITSFFERYGRAVTENNRRQAYFPSGATVIANQIGTAPGFFIETAGTVVFVLPGPPHEMQRMFERDVALRLASIFDRPPLRVETLRTFGVGESQLLEWFGELLAGLDVYDVSSLPWATGVDIILTARRGADAKALSDEAERVAGEMGARLGTKLYERGERSLGEVVGDLLTRRGETLAIAESLTGGMISQVVTDAAGSSAYFLANAVTYSNESKVDLVGVDPRVLQSEGAVSEVVCRQMADGVRARVGATWGMATTGIAGPTGATETKPLGLTYLGLSWDGGVDVRKRVFSGEREIVRKKAAFGALWMLYDRLVRGTD